MVGSAAEALATYLHKFTHSTEFHAKLINNKDENIMPESIRVVSIGYEEYNQIIEVLKQVESTNDWKPFHELVESLAEEQKYHLRGIFWLGRNDIEHWHEIFYRVGDLEVLGGYLAGKNNLMHFIQTGWATIPPNAKVPSYAEYKKVMAPLMAEPTTRFLAELTATVVRIETALDGYLITKTIRPDCSLDFLKMMYQAHQLHCLVLENQKLGMSWYGEKIERLHSFAVDAVSYWVMDHENYKFPNPKSVPMTERQWLLEGILSGLYGVKSQTNKLMQGALEDGIDLFSKKS